MATRTAKEWAALEEATAANLNKAAGGWIGSAANSSDQSGITSTVDLTDLSETVTANTSRRILVMAQAVVTVSSAAAAVVGRIRKNGADGGTWCNDSTFDTGETRLCGGFYYDNPNAGTVTYNMALGRASGTGTLGVSGTSPQQARIIIIDVGTVS